MFFDAKLTSTDYLDLLFRLNSILYTSRLP